jgi:hypothetical protein
MFMVSKLDPPLPSPQEVCLPEALYEDILVCSRSNLADTEQNISHLF